MLAAHSTGPPGPRWLLTQAGGTARSRAESLVLRRGHRAGRSGVFPALTVRACRPPPTDQGPWRRLGGAAQCGGMHAEEIARAVELATRAPSVHNTQPWRFRADGDVLDLYADRSRQLAHLDPLGRQLTLSCGAALLFARVALGTTGLAHRVEIMPDPDDFDTSPGSS